MLDVFHGYLLESNIKFEEVNNAKMIFISTGSHTNSIRSVFEDGRDLGYKFEMGEVVAKAVRLFEGFIKFIWGYNRGRTNNKSAYRGPDV